MAIAISTTGRVLVLVARMAPGFTALSSSANSAVFTARSSTTDSITRSQSARSAMRSVAERRPRMAALSSAVIFSRETCLSRPFSIDVIIASAVALLRDRTMTS